MIDSQHFIYLPRWVKIMAVVILLISLATALYIALSFLGNPEGSNWILIALSLAQVSASGLIVTLVIFFSERDVSISNLLHRTDDFLQVHLVEALEKIDLSALVPDARMEVFYRGRKDIFGAVIELRYGAERLRLWAGVNVQHLIIIYFLPAESERQASQLVPRFDHTFDAARAVGHTVKSTFAVLPSGEKVVALWTSVDVGLDFLTNAKEKLYWAQDIAMMTQSFWRSAARQNVTVYTASEPAPL